MYEYSTLEAAQALYENFGIITLCDGDRREVYGEREAE